MNSSKLLQPVGLLKVRLILYMYVLGGGGGGGGGVEGGVLVHDQY